MIHEINLILRNCRLDIGEGKEINLEKCPRAKLQQQCIKYLSPVSFPLHLCEHPIFLGYI